MITALAVLCGVGIVMAILLAVGRHAFAVELDNRFEQLMEVLPGANCGGCGYAGCSGYAQGLVDGAATPTACPPGGPDVAIQIGRILGVEVKPPEPKMAVVCCAGDNQASPLTGTYHGIRDCRAAHAVAGGTKACSYGCLGLGSCFDVCVFGAIKFTDNGLVVIDRDKCTACGTCVAICPRKVISLVPRKDEVHVLCVNPEKAKAVKAVCSVGCTACKLCNKQSNRMTMKGQLAAVAPDIDAEIPASTALACPQGTIVDIRETTLIDWINNPEMRKRFETRQEEWKGQEKARKAGAREKKAPVEASADKGGEA